MATTQSHESPDDMLDLRTGSSIQVSPRLLSKRDWINRPCLIHKLLNEAASCGNQLELAALAADYLSLSSTEFHIKTPNQAPDCDIFIILGHVLNADTTPKPELVARLEMALLASKRHVNARLIVSGGGQTAGAEEATVMKQWLVNRGVSEKRVLTECRSRDTVENITFSVAMLDQNVRTVCLISGFQHIERAASLLSSCLSQINAKIHAFHLVSTTRVGRDCLSSEDLAEERFLLFKDLGRILGIWRYREWRMPPGNRLSL